MRFVHDDSDFRSLIVQVSEETGVSPALVEKDYWITHCLWAIQESGLEIWFKGGTSLSNLLLDDPAKRREIELAYARIGPMFWGSRIALDDACKTIRQWIDTLGE
jgi:hypothetical protein